MIKTQSGNILIKPLLAIFFILIIVISCTFFYGLPQNQENKQIENTRATSSTNITIKALDISFIIHSDFNKKERSNSVELNKNEKKIEVSKIGTNFISAQDYIKDISIKNNLTFIKKESIKNNEIIKTIRITSDKKEELTFWLYNNYRMYFVTTTDKDLYPLTEEVARSIKFD